MSNEPGTETQPSTEPAAAIADAATPPSSAESESDVIPVTTNKIYTKDDLLIHNRDGDLWLAIDGTVYDLTKFSEEHPGGKKILLGVAGTDASKKYRKYHGDNILQRYAQEYKIGTLRVEAKKESGGLFSMFKRRK
ncbi:cytochrome b5-like heme/steroid binding domain-containing protein [Aspergillus foveolatus]|uniref:cytochrome b5-like heme/steroid binding domain-containing protein n=1 Tax=Aspergillus foveolatus TaxID=210207 RepID=UPI003CCD8BF2